MDSPLPLYLPQRSSRVISRWMATLKDVKCLDLRSQNSVTSRICKMGPEVATTFEIECGFGLLKALTTCQVDHPGGVDEYAKKRLCWYYFWVYWNVYLIISDIIQIRFAKLGYCWNLDRKTFFFWGIVSFEWELPLRANSWSKSEKKVIGSFLIFFTIMLSHCL